MSTFQSGFVSLFGRPNAGKSTLLNALIGDKLAIVSPKVQTTRHRIKGFLSGENYQIVFSDTPGIIDPKYLLQQKMMQQVKNALEDSDVAILLYDLTTNKLEEADELFLGLKLKVPSIVVCNKSDAVQPRAVQEALDFFGGKPYAKRALTVSASAKAGLKGLISEILKWLPEGFAFYNTEDLSDLPTRFFVGELIREKVFGLYHDELPYQTAVLVQEFTEKSTLIKIRSDIIVQRESQKAIILGDGGKMIKTLGTEARKAIEDFLGQKVFLELFVKVKPKWRDDELKLREYGY